MFTNKNVNIVDVRIFYSRAKLFVIYLKKKNQRKKLETKSQKQAREYDGALVRVDGDARNRFLVVVGVLDWPSYCSYDSASLMYPVRRTSQTVSHTIYFDWISRGRYTNICLSTYLRSARQPITLSSVSLIITVNWVLIKFKGKTIII